ncbi:hypothetical protein BN424_76 [Carnobacterium maltaromaticum LMA28]|uniref:Mor transcription activator domain-containing protein n=1 Tax=Carnobacterium maltaromaticum LMA28 TaxID=1234679 RepID=K8E1D4_CARML|nr:Mor transcription activator family protein [Carnobacterium maltaromaticum]CCO09559.2 hypothetical protein BN424_76 [Carnobacterium maltaromaticum LMA28]
MDIEKDLLASLYDELYDNLGEEAMVKVYQLYGGMTLNMPKKLYNSKKVKISLKHKYKNKSNINRNEIKEIMGKYGYSERHIYRIIRY